MFSSASDKAKANLKLHNISVSPKMVKNVIMDLDLSKASVVVVLQWRFYRTVNRNFLTY